VSMVDRLIQAEDDAAAVRVLHSHVPPSVRVCMCVCLRVCVCVCARARGAQYRGALVTVFLSVLCWRAIHHTM
jgi:hypothetical protein